MLGLKFPDMSRPETLQKKYVGKVSRKALNFMKILLNMEPNDRPISKECLANSYFDGLVAPVLSLSQLQTSAVSSSSSSSGNMQNGNSNSNSNNNHSNSHSTNAQVRDMDSIQD